ncbi:MAG: hypothetical protein ACK5OB_18410 [Pirellula sp.]
MAHRPSRVWHIGPVGVCFGCGKYWFSNLQEDDTVSILHVTNIWKESERLGNFNVEGLFRVKNRSSTPVRIHGLFSHCNCVGKWLEVRTVPPEGQLDFSVNADVSSLAPEILVLNAFTAQRKFTIMWKLDPKRDLILKRQAE